MSELQMRFAQIDPSAKQDIVNIVASPMKSWAVINDLRYDNLPLPSDHVNLTHNFWSLTGTKKEFPNDTAGKTWGFVSEAYSGADAKFSPEVLPTIDITFDANHKSRGLTLYFYPHTNDYPRFTQVTWYDLNNAVLRSGIYEFNTVVAEINEVVASYRRIKIEFLETNLPYRYVQMYAIDFGIIRVLVDAEISVCTLYEEIDPTVETISVNTMNANIRTRESIFSPITSGSFEDMMMTRQPLTIRRDGELFGVFFLEKWRDPFQSGTAFDLEAGDAVSVLDMYSFDGGLYTDKLITELLDELFGIVFPTGIIKYELDPDFQNSRVTGWIPLGTCGYAFQLIMFALNAIADTSRRDFIWIYPLDTEPEYYIPLFARDPITGKPDGQYLKGSDEPTDYYSGVDVFSYSYSLGTEVRSIFDDELQAGTHKLTFREPMHSLSITGGTIVQAHVNFAIVNVSIYGKVTLSGIAYVENVLTHSVREPEMPAGEIEKIKDFEGYTLVSHDVGLSIAQSQYEYLQKRIRSENNIVLHDKEVGYIATIQTRGKNVEGIITSLDINLRANKATVVTVGDVKG